jgi:hypothetical protein
MGQLFEEGANQLDAQRAAEAQKDTAFKEELATAGQVQNIEKAREARGDGSISSYLQATTDSMRNSWVGQALQMPVATVKGFFNGFLEMGKAFGELGPKDSVFGPDGLAKVASAAQDVNNGAFDNYLLPEGSDKSLLTQIPEGVGRFAAGMVGPGRVIKIADGLMPGVITALAKGAVIDYSAFDPKQENLDALIKSYPALKNPISDYLATDPNDPDAYNRARNALEGAAITVVGEAGVKVLTKGLDIYAAARARTAAAIRTAEAEKAARAIPVPESEPSAPIQEAPSTGKASGIDTLVADPSKPIIDASQQQLDAAAGALRSDTNQTGNALRASSGPELSDFNIDKLDWNSFGGQASDIYNVLETTSRVFEDEINTAKGGVVSLEQSARDSKAALSASLEQAAALTGGTPETIAESLFADVRADGGPTALTARLRAAHSFMLASAGRVNRMIALAREGQRIGGVTSMTSMANLKVAIEQHAAIQAAVKGSTSEVARAMNSLKALRTTSGVDFARLGQIDENLLKGLANAKDLVDLNKMVRNAAGKRWTDYAHEFWINGLLWTASSANVAGNSVKTALAIPERGVAAAIGSIRKALGQDVERVRGREILSVTHGIVKGLADAFRLPTAGTAAKLVEHVKAWDLDAAKQLMKDNADEFGTVYRSIATGESAFGAGKLETHGPAIHWDPNLYTSNVTKTTARVANVAGSIIRTPGAALQAEDEAFKSIAYRQQLEALATRRALERADATVQLAPGQRDSVFNAEYSRLMKDPPEDLHLASVDFAQYQTFTNKLGESGAAFQHWVNKTPLAKFIFPFVRTPANILKDFTRYTPVPIDLLQKEFRKSLISGGAKADLALSRMAIGTAAMAAVIHLADQGAIVGGGPAGPDTGELDGIKPYSIKLPDGQWYQFNRLEPMGTLLGVVADFHDIIHRQYQLDGDNSQLEDLAKVIALSAAKNAISKTYLQGLSGVVNALSDPERRGGPWVDQMVTSFLPLYSLGKAARNIEDPMARNVFDLADSIRNASPLGDSAELGVRRDYLGRAVEHGRPWLSPIGVSEKSTDPVDNELARLSFPVQMPDRSISGIPLNGKQYSRLLELRGTIGGESSNLHASLAQLIASDGYKALSDSPDTTIHNGTKAALISMLVNKYHESATKILFAEDPKLQAMVKSEQIRRQTGVKVDIPVQ